MINPPPLMAGTDQSRQNMCRKMLNYAVHRNVPGAYATYWSAPHTATYVVHHICSGSEPVKPRMPPTWNGLREDRESGAGGQTAKAMSASKLWNITMSDSPGSERAACQEGMCSE